jgi:RNA polymerase sigma factor (sigma-70 family)
MGITRGQLAYRLKLYSIKKKHAAWYTPEERARIFRLIDQHGPAAAAAMLGMEPKTLYSMKWKHKKAYFVTTGDPVQAIKIRKRARWWATKRGMSEIGEEFASFAIEYWLKTRCSALRTTWAEFRRERAGRGGQRLAPGGLLPLQEEELASGDPGPSAVLESSNNRNRVEDMIRAARISRLARVALLLFYGEGWTVERIARLFGVSESRVSQMNTATVAQLRTAVGGIET